MLCFSCCSISHSKDSGLSSLGSNHEKDLVLCSLVRQPFSPSRFLNRYRQLNLGKYKPAWIEFSISIHVHSTHEAGGGGVEKYSSPTVFGTGINVQ